MAAVTGFADILTQRLTVALRGAITPKMLGQIAGNTVRNLHEGMIARHQAPSVYERFVDGRQGAAETSIRLDLESKRTGEIDYRGTEGSSLSAAAAFALQEAELRSPKLTGQYAASWLVLIDGLPVADPASIPPSADMVTIVNTAPFSERLEQGALRGTRISAKRS